MDGYDHSDACLHASVLAGSQMPSAVLTAAIELKLFDIIASIQEEEEEAHASPGEIASRLPTRNADAPRRLDRVLRLLASHSLLTCSTRSDGDGNVERVYGISAVGRLFVKKEDGPTWASIFPGLTYHPSMAALWLNLKDAIVEGDVDLFEKMNGQPRYQYMKQSPALKQVFQRAMTDLSTLHMEKILETYKGFEGLSNSTLVNVGGGFGQSLNMIISKYPSIKGINFDLPHVVQDAPSYPGIEHVGGDMFRSVPKGDAIMIKGTSHNWSDEKCVKLFRNCYERLEKGGKVIVIDLIMPEEAEVSIRSKCFAIFDAVVLAEGNGRERSEKEFEVLCKTSGFSQFKVACRAMSILGVMEFFK